MWEWEMRQRDKWCNCHDECDRLTSPISDVENWILPELERKRETGHLPFHMTKSTHDSLPLLPWVCDGKNEEKCPNPWSKLPKDRPSDDAVGNREKYYDYNDDQKEDLTTSTSFFLSQESIVGLKAVERDKQAWALRVDSDEESCVLSSLLDDAISSLRKS